MDNVFKKIIFSYCFLLLVLTTSLFSQNGYKTIVKLTDLSDDALLNKMQMNASGLLSEMNEAFYQNRELKIKSNIVSDDAKEILSSLWATSPIRCIETQIIERVLKMKRGNKYQVRNIPVFVKDVFAEDFTNSSDTTSHYYEICLTFNSTGVIENIFYTLESNIYDKLINEGVSENDIGRREFILEFIENFRTAYNRKDIDFLKKVYSDDALIITGKVIKTEHSDMMNQLGEVVVKYQVQDKKQYLETVQNRIFKNNKYMNIVFDDIKIVKDLKYEEVYGVNIKICWKTQLYKDIGYMFLMIDFMDDANPVLLFRAWQPEDTEQTKKGIFGLHSFEIIR